jgi:hypothetical protein
MSRKLTVILLTMLVLVGAMGLKTVVVTHGDGSVMMANGGGGPVPPLPPLGNGGGGPVPPLPPASAPWK